MYIDKVISNNQCLWFFLTVTVLLITYQKNFNKKIKDIKDGMSNFCSIALNFGTCIYHTMSKLSHAPITPPPFIFFVLDDKV